MNRHSNDRASQDIADLQAEGYPTGLYVVVAEQRHVGITDKVACDPETCPAGAHDDADGEWPLALCRNCHRRYDDPEGCE